jgi:hypothetical protein
MPQVSDKVAGKPIGFKMHADNRITLTALVGATATAGTPQKIYMVEHSWYAVALEISTGTATNPIVQYIGVPETAGTTGQYIDYCIAGPTKMLSTAVFIESYPALFTTGSTCISGTTAITTPVGGMREIGMWREALPTTAVSTALMKIWLRGLPLYLTS